ncbi:MAG TPA: sialidase family protein, partial [Ramlibacter sp.]
MQTIPPSRLRVTAAIAALWLSACGGGGDDGALPITAAPAPGAAVQTASIAATVAPALTWTLAEPTPRVWHSLSTNATGDILVAGEAPAGQVHVSSDGGATWTAGNSPSGVWISSAVSRDGSLIVAVQYDGGMFMSTNRGASWTRVTNSPLVDAAGGVGFEAVTVSQDGRRIAAVVQNGPIVLSADGGATWTRGPLPDEPQTRWWRWIDGS